MKKNSLNLKDFMLERNSPPLSQICIDRKKCPKETDHKINKYEFLTADFYGQFLWDIFFLSIHIRDSCESQKIVITEDSAKAI